MILNTDRIRQALSSKKGRNWSRATLIGLVVAAAFALFPLGVIRDATSTTREATPTAPVAPMRADGTVTQSGVPNQASDEPRKAHGEAHPGSQAASGFAANASQKDTYSDKESWIWMERNPGEFEMLPPQTSEGSKGPASGGN